MCGCCDGAALNWPSLPQLWFCFLFFCFLKKYDFQTVCWKLNYMHSRSSCLSLWFTHSTYFSDYLLSNYHPPGTLLLFSCPVVSDSSRPHGPHHLPEFAQVHVHCIVDAFQPSHPPLPTSPSAFNLSQHQGLFQWVSCSHQVARVLEFSFSISPSNEYSGLISFKIDFKILISNPEIRFYLIQVGC